MPPVWLTLHLMLVLMVVSCRTPVPVAPAPTCDSVVVTTLTGNGMGGYVDGTGGADGTTEFSVPTGIGVDAAANIYVGEYRHIRKVAPDGTTTTLAGNGAGGYRDGSGGPMGTAEIELYWSIAADAAGNVFVPDTTMHIRKIASDGTTTTLTGNGQFGWVDGTGGPNGTSEFDNPQGIAVDAAGTLYIADAVNRRIRKVAPDGSTTTLTGNGGSGFVDGSGGATGTTQFRFPAGAAVDVEGNVYIADLADQRIRKIAPDGTTTTLAGNGTRGYVDGSGGPGGTTEFAEPRFLAVDANGIVYVGEGDHIRGIARDGTTTTVAGSADRGYQDGSGCAARFAGELPIAILGRVLYVAESGNNRVRQIRLP